MRRIVVSVAALFVFAAAASCVNVKAPENIEIGSGGGKSYYSSGSHSAPNPQTLDACKADLNQAYSRIDSLERKCDGLEKDKKKYKDERDEWKDKYKKLKDRYDD